MTEIVIAIIGSGALSTLITALVNAYTKKKEKDDDITLLLYHDIRSEADAHIAAGEIHRDDLEVLIKMHKRYHDRGGNGYLDRRMEQVYKLKIIG